MDDTVFLENLSLNIPVSANSLTLFPDYDITIYPLAEDDTHYTALNMNYSVAGFQAGGTSKQKGKLLERGTSLLEVVGFQAGTL